MHPRQHGGAVGAAIYQVACKDMAGIALGVAGGNGCQHEIQQIGAAMQIADDAERLRRARQYGCRSFAGAKPTQQGLCFELYAQQGAGAFLILILPF